MQMQPVLMSLQSVDVCYDHLGIIWYADAACPYEFKALMQLSVFFPVALRRIKVTVQSSSQNVKTDAEIQSCRYVMYFISVSVHN